MQIFDWLICIHKEAANKTHVLPSSVSTPWMDPLWPTQYSPVTRYRNHSEFSTRSGRQHPRRVINGAGQGLNNFCFPCTANRKRNGRCCFAAPKSPLSITNSGPSIPRLSNNTFRVIDCRLMIDTKNGPAFSSRNHFSRPVSVSPSPATGGGGGGGSGGSTKGPTGTGDMRMGMAEGPE